MEKRTKRELRAEVREKRARLSAADKAAMDESILKAILNLEVIQKASCVYCYVALPGEVETRGMIEAMWKSGIRVAAPKISGKEMEFYEITSWDQLETGYRGIAEPGTGCPRADAADAVILVPGAAFDSEGRRVGYGGGYFDKFLAREPGHLTVAVAYDFQIFPEVPEEEHDRRVDLLVTP